MLLLLSSLASAGWTKNSDENDCVFYIGDRAGAYAPVRAECNWPIPAAKLQKLVAKSGDHDDYFSAVAESTVLAPTTGGNLVYQRHQASGISDREIVLVMGEEPIPGGTRYAWTRAADQSKITGKHVACLVDDGKWEVSDNGAGGSKVVYELMYDPGGTVPSFLVRWFQGSGTRTLVGELRTWAETH